MRLSELRKGVRGRVVGFQADDKELEAKLREIGFGEEDEVEIAHFGPVFGKPICARLNQTLIALRIEEAAAIVVEVAP